MAVGILAIGKIDQRYSRSMKNVIILHLFAQRTPRNMALYITHKIILFVKMSLRRATYLRYLKSAPVNPNP